MLTIRTMTEADVALGMALKREAGWNQIEADWRRFLALEPTGCFVAEYAGVPCGTVTTCIFGPVAWIAMVLVAQAQRGKGIGTALMEHALAYLDGRGVPSVRLDATPAGRPLYEKLGFAAEYQVTRWGGRPAAVEAPAEVRPYSAEHREAVAALDAVATGAERSKLLERLAGEGPEAAWVTVREGELTGYMLGRTGDSAAMVGPGAAREEADGRALLSVALAARRAELVLVDVPAPNESAAAVVQRAGLTEQRAFTRMVRGQPVVDHPELVWASSGAEKG